jgi:hypothetical protein
MFCLVSLPLACLEFVFASFSLRFASFRIFLVEAKKGHPKDDKYVVCTTLIEKMVLISHTYLVCILSVN